MTRYRTTVIQDLPALRARLPEWERLYGSSRVANPFAHPEWMCCWAEHFLGDRELHVVCTYDGDALVGVAPLYRDDARWGGKRLRMLGGGHQIGLLDLPQVLAAAGEERRVLRATVQHLIDESPRWDWAELVVAPEQGWFEQEWLPQNGRRAGAVALHVGVEACVVRPLEGGWNVVRSQLKGSAREAIRRSRRAFERDGHDWRVELAEGDDVEAAMSRLIELHAARARHEGHASRGDYLADHQRRAFFLEIARRQASRGELAIALLYVDDDAVGAMALVRGNDATYLSLTGFDPAFWHHSPLTLLQAECLRLFADRGDRCMNLGFPPTVARLRWSEAIEQHNKFVIVGPRRRSRALYRAYALSRLASEQRHLGRDPGTPALPANGALGATVVFRDDSGVARETVMKILG